MTLIDDTSMKDWLQSESAYEKKRLRMKYNTLDTVINGHKFKAEYVYNTDYALPEPIETCYENMFTTVQEVYHNVKYISEFAYNIIMRK